MFKRREKFESETSSVAPGNVWNTASEATLTREQEAFKLHLILCAAFEVTGYPEWVRLVVGAACYQDPRGEI
ncbi:hypothetical protein J6590_023483 [Homalodisca vitripennis]|nr:hypothetical protein J6590_023483 [Homalodisca vitripennis]